MRIEEFTADDHQVVAEAVEVLRAAAEADAPWVHPSTPTSLAGILRHGWDGEPPRAFVARDEQTGRVAGVTEFWVSEWDNRDLAWLDIVVHPELRRQGVGTELFEAMTALARETGRTKVGADGWESDAVFAFAARHGLTKASQAINRRQYLADVDAALLAKLYDEAERAAGGYELIRIAGPVPDDLVERLADLAASINDAPTDDLDIEDEVYTVERIRGYEAACAGRGQRVYRLIARHADSGELAGHTVVAVEEERPAVGHQHDTSVARAHRGHRLGLLLKTDMVRWLAEVEPQLESVDTWNAESNDHMIGVNEQLGYRVLGRGVQFQKTLDR